MKKINTREPTESEVILLEKMRESLNENMYEYIELSEKLGIEPIEFLNLWINTITNSFVSLMMHIADSSESPIEIKREFVLSKLKSFIEISMLIADKKIKEKWGEK